MNKRKLISSLITFILIAMGSAQADNITSRDDLFYDVNKQSNSNLDSFRIAEYKKSQTHDSASTDFTQTSNFTTRDDLFHYIQIGNDKNSTLDTIHEFSSIEFRDTDSASVSSIKAGNMTSRDDLFHY